MGKTSLEDSYVSLFKFMQVAKRRVFAMGTEHGLTGMQAVMILLLDCPRPMNAFSKIFNCDASNITGLVDGLQEKGLASRFEDPDDRRIKIVQLTARGKKLRTHFFKHIDTQENPIFSKLDSQERATFVALLQKLTDES
ncbi:MAG: MarR family transcriptional regulator [Candidatus Saccharimonadales bacterium]